MYSRFQLAWKYVNYYLASANGRGYGIHSPFVFDFVTKVLNDDTEHSGYSRVEALRKELLHDHRILEIEDYGAGSGASGSNKRSVQSIARHAAKPRKYAQLLYRMVKHYQPLTIFDLGTSLGITTSYLSLANPRAKVLTFEGSPVLSKAATENFRRLNLENINMVEGNFDYTLVSALHFVDLVDFAFIDGNHRRVPTENYFQWLLPKCGNDTILVFDDIHWSLDMENAWNTVRHHPSVRCSIDLFFMGIILFRHEFLEKQHFTIRF